MSQKIEPGKFVEVAYDIYDVKPDGSEEKIHEVPATDPEKFIFGVTPHMLPALLDALEGKTDGDCFDVTMTPQEGFGEYQDDFVRIEELPKEIFEVDGKIDPEQIHPEAKIMLQTNMGQPVPATVIEIQDKSVRVAVDFNHPLAGKTVKLVGKVLKVREATAEEIAIQQAQAGGCGCNGGSCGEGCDCADKGCNCDK
ncbi:MAG: peptidylprolyl isomerase [Muribaculaceae bacterium]|nr:peptidylprolyl isomerase [Muribaculaceae bacterium]